MVGGNLVILFCTLLGVSRAHVRLDFPRARDLALDFLDNVRTPAPCGMPKGPSKTSLEAGTRFNVTWHLAYPHQGGFKLELFGADDNLLKSLTPEDGGSQGDGFLDEDTTARSHQIELPEDLECIGCTIRLMRQAIEWSGGYRFWTCADVDIYKPSTLSKRQLCTENGVFDEATSACVCDKKYYGMQCQFKNDCHEDSDCLNGGKCIDIESTSSPTKVCFCAMGYFGQFCEIESDLSSPVDLEDKAYTKKNYKGIMDVYWKILKDTDEIEVALQARTESYLAFGFRPSNLEQSCQAFPQLGKGDEDLSTFIEAESRNAQGIAEPEGEAESEAEAEAEGRSVAEPEGDEGSYAEAESEAEAEGKSEDDADAESEAEAEAVVRLLRETEDDGESEAESEAEAEAELRSLGEADAESEAESEAEAEAEGRSVAEPEGEAEAEAEGRSVAEAEGRSVAEPEGEAEAEGRSVAEPEGEAEGRSVAEPEGEAEAEGRSVAEPEGGAEAEGRSVAEPEGEAEGADYENEKVEARNAGRKHKYQPRSKSLHPMDCTDIIIGMARGEYSKVYDAYTRDRSTPMPDIFYNGQDDLTGAIGYEKEGVTTVVFRRSLKTFEPTDHSIEDEPMMVIWAVGQTIGSYSHKPDSGLEKGTASIPEFYKPDEVKYHGKENRGFVMVNFFDTASGPTNEFKHPSGCLEPDCQYIAKWTVANNMLDVTVTGKAEDKDWVAIGFSENSVMAETDIVAGYFDDEGNGIVKDYYATGYSSPAADDSQDILEASIERKDGFTTINFKKSLEPTTDEKDIGLNQPVHLVFPYSGGSVIGSGIIGKHRETPEVTQNQMNFLSEETTESADEESQDDYGSHNNNIQDLVEAAMDPQVEDNTGDIETTIESHPNSSVGDIVFACTSSSNKRIISQNDEPTTIKYEECPINLGGAFRELSGEFIAPESGIYDFSANALLKTDQDEGVVVRLKRGNVAIATTEASADGDAKVGTSGALYATIYLQKGDSVYLEVEGKGLGGVVNSDWYPLKFYGHKRAPTTPVLTCAVRVVKGEVAVKNCIGENDSSISVDNASNGISLSGEGVFRVSVTGSILAGTDCDSVSLSLQPVQAGRLSTDASLKASLLFDQQHQPKTSTNILLPAAFQFYALKVDDFASFPLEIGLSLNAGDCSNIQESAVAHGFIEVVTEPKNAQLISCALDSASNVTGIVRYNFCQASQKSAESWVESGVFTAPFDGYYVISFSGTLTSYEGTRIWININKKQKGAQDEKVIGAGFSGVYHKEDPQGMVVQTSPSVSTLEKLSKDDKIWISIGKKSQGSALTAHVESPALFNVRLISST